MEGTLSFQVIWINGMPRSGTSWLSQIFDSHPDVRFRLSPFFSYEFKNYVHMDSVKSEWLDFFQKVFESDNEFMTQLSRRKNGEYPFFDIKSNNPFFLVIKSTRFHNLVQKVLSIFPSIKIVHIIRNPCAVINSWIKAPREFKDIENYNLYWKNGYNRKTSEEEFWGFDDWVELTYLYLNLCKTLPEQVLVVRYEELVNNTQEEVKKIFDFCNIKISSQTAAFLEKCHSFHHQNEYAVFKDKDKVLNDWKSQLDKEIIDEIIQELEKTELYQFVLD